MCSPAIRATIRRRPFCSGMARGSGLSGLAGMLRATPASKASSAWSGRCSTVPKARLIATLGRGGHRVRRRSVQPRSALHARAAARAAADAGGEGLDAAPVRAAGAAACGELTRRLKLRWTRRRGGGPAAPWTDGRPVTICTPCRSRDCRPRWPCACSAAPSRIAVARGRFSSASSKRLSKHSAAH